MAKSRGKPFQKGYDPRRKLFTNEDRQQATEVLVPIRRHKRLSKCIETASKPERRRRVIEEQNGVCLKCGISEWNGKPLSLELDHIDGNKRNNKRENLRVLCPNCHSQTPTFRNKKRATDGNGIPEPLKTDRFSVRV